MAAPQPPAPPSGIEALLKLPPMDGLSPSRACDVFLKSEEFYVEHALRVVCEFEIRLKNHTLVDDKVLEDDEIAALFLNVQQIYDFNQKLYNELLNYRLEGRLLEEVGVIMVKFIPFFKLYTQYIREYRKSQQTLEILKEKRKKFERFLILNELCAGNPLKVLLLAPVARLPQYLVFVGGIVKNMTDNSSEAFQKLINAVRALQQVTDEISFNLRDDVARKLVVTVQQKIFGNKVDLVSPSRFVVKHGDLYKLYNKSGRHVADGKAYIFILFNDMLLYGERPGRFSAGKLKHILQLSATSVEDIIDDGKIKNALKLMSDTKSFIVCAPNREEKIKWLNSLKEQIAIAQTNAGSLKKQQQTGAQLEKQVKKQSIISTQPSQRNLYNPPPPSSPPVNPQPLFSTNNYSATNNYNASSLSFSGPTQRSAVTPNSLFSNGSMPSSPSSPPMMGSAGYPSSPPSPGTSYSTLNGGYTNNTSGYSTGSGNYSSSGNPSDNYASGSYPSPPPPPTTASRPPPPTPPIPPASNYGGGYSDGYSDDYSSAQSSSSYVPETSEYEAPYPPAAPGAPVAPPPPSGPTTSSYQRAAPPPPPTAVWNGQNVENALKESLTRYRQYVQDDEDDIHDQEEQFDFNS